MPNERIGVTTTVAAGQDAIGIYPDDAAFIETFPAAGPYLLSDGFSLESPLPVFVSDTPAYRDSAGTLLDAIRVRGISSPASVYGENLRGWWDVQDLSTMYQDRAGTIPVTAAGQAVGLHLSKDGRGLGPDLRGLATIGMTGSSAPATFDPVTGAGSVHRVSGNNTSYVQLNPPTFERLYAWDVENLGPGVLRLQERLNSILVKLIGVGERHRIYATSPAAILGWRLQPAIDGESVSFVTHSVAESLSAHRVASNDANRPLLQWDADAGAYYLLANGSNTHMSVPMLDMTNTDEVGLFAAVYKGGAGATNLVVELSESAAAYNGAWALSTPSGAGNSNNFDSKGTVLASAGRNFVEIGVKMVIAAGAKISIPVIFWIENARPKVSYNASQGSGSYGRYPLHFYRRRGSAGSFLGRDYGMHLIDRLPTDAETAWSRAHLNSIIKAY